MNVSTWRHGDHVGVPINPRGNGTLFSFVLAEKMLIDHFDFQREISTTVIDLRNILDYNEKILELEKETITACA